MSELHDAVVIGTGFGGSINALRLAQAGKSVLILERGKRYKPGDFPRDVRDVDSLLWRYPKRPGSLGLFDLRVFSGIATVSASAVGGGSLIYANIHIRPDAEVFEDPRWPSSISRQSLDPYYDMVAESMGVSPVPRDIALRKRDVFRAAADHLGREVFDPDQAVAWQDPGEPGRQACRLVAMCEFGCQFGAKNTLDFTYLAKAEELGAQVAPNSHVSHIAPDGKGYRVHYTDLGNGARESVSGRRVVVSAGTLGTNEILLRSRDVDRGLPDLSRQLGHGFSGNGDLLGSIQNSDTDLEPWDGPDVTSVIRYFDGPEQFTMAAPTFNREVMEVLASMGQPSGRLLRLVAPLLWPRLGRLIPWAFSKGLVSRLSRFPVRNAGPPARMANLFAIGRDNANGVIRLKRGRVDVEWDYARENRALIDRMISAMKDVSDFYGGTFAPIISWAGFKKTITVHPLGGCRLSESPDTGVVSSQGEVHGYPGLFIADGSVIPSSIGFHPVMTIAAVSERIAEAVVGSYGGGY